MKPNSTRKISFDWDQKEFEKNVEELIKEIPEEITDILTEAAPEFSKAAAKYTPPCIGKGTIEKKYYTRPILVLVRLIRGGYQEFKATDEDRKQFKAGMVFKVLDTRSGKPKGTAYGYAKTKGAAKKLSVIHTRGLARVMWGKDLPSIKAAIPSTILRLMRKAKDLDRLNYSDASLYSEEDETVLTIENKAKRVESFGRLAEKHGYKKIMNVIMKKLKTLVDRKQEL
jgi:hypothetical protein